MTRKKTTDEQRKEARRAYLREYMRRRYAESAEFRETRKKMNRAYYLVHRREIGERQREYRANNSDKYHAIQRETRMRYPDRVAERNRRYCARIRALKEAIYVNDFHQRDSRVRYIGCRLEIDKETMAVTGKAVVLKDGDLAEIWSSKTYSADVPWLKAVSNAYKQFRKFRREMAMKRKKEGMKNA